MERLRGWHVLKLEFWHVPHPELNLRCVFASFFFAVFSNKKLPTWRATLYKNNRALPFASFFWCSLRVSHFASAFGGGGGGGVVCCKMTGREFYYRGLRRDLGNLGIQGLKVRVYRTCSGFSSYRGSFFMQLYYAPPNPAQIIKAP